LIFGVLACNEGEAITLPDSTTPHDLVDVEADLPFPDWFFDGMDLPPEQELEDADLPDFDLDTDIDADTDIDQDSQELPDGVSFEGALRVELLDIGQGDAILLRSSDGRVALIDGGRSSDRLMAHLREKSISRIHLMVATHADADHIGGLRAAVLAYPVDVYVDNGLPHTTATYEDLMEAVELKAGEYRTARKGLHFDFGEHVDIDVLWPGTQSSSDQNAMSVVLRVTHASNCFLLTGDADYRVEDALLQEGVGRCNVLKVSHHGADNATTSRFVDTVRPLLAGISVGNNNYGHPTSTTLNTLTSRQIEVLRTDLEGTIEFVSNADGALCYRTSKNPSYECPIGTVQPTEQSLVLAEVYYDNAEPSSDNGYEWVKLYNASDEELVLDDYALGWGGSSYAYGTLQLAGRLPAGGCWLVGGPESSAANGSPVYDQSLVLTPNLQNGGDTADGVALFKLQADEIGDSSIPIDAVLYGTNNASGLLGAGGGVALPHVGTAPAGSSIRRSSSELWELNSSPSPAECPSW
jgi:beta-lactamase superfamily II metal-dependent hydrolase